MGRTWLQLDVFTRTPLEGNPLAVVLDAEGLDTARMQAIAGEMNLSETTFVSAPERGGDARVRIFTPRIELPFAGHPSLGTGWVLSRRLGKQRVVLEENAGDIAVEFEDSGVGWLGHPGADLVPFSGDALRALGLERVAAHPTLRPAVTSSPPLQVLVPVGSPADVDAAVFDTAGFSALRVHNDVALYVFALDGDRAYARMFAPLAGVPEDPATGSAAGVLGLHLEAAGVMPGLLVIEQGVKMGRASRLMVRRRDGRLEVGGEAVQVSEGKLDL